MANHVRPESGMIKRINATLHNGYVPATLAQVLVYLCHHNILATRVCQPCLSSPDTVGMLTIREAGFLRAWRMSESGQTNRYLTVRTNHPLLDAFPNLLHPRLHPLSFS